MRIIRGQEPGRTPFYGLLEGETIQVLDTAPFGEYRLVRELSLAAVTLLPPCEPSKIVAVGINYRPHAEELDFAVPAEPLLFLKPPSAVIGPGAAIVLPNMSGQVEYEGELAVVMGRRTRNISPERVLASVLGYTCLNDVTARDLQKKDIQFTRSKSFDTFAPLGPWIETEVDPTDLLLETRLNDAVRQQTRTSELIRPVTELISFISRVMTLEPGDVVATGTPAGVGRLAAGDRVSVTIEGIGTLTNQVTASPEPLSL